MSGCNKVSSVEAAGASGFTRLHEIPAQMIRKNKAKNTNFLIH